MSFSTAGILPGSRAKKKKKKEEEEAKLMKNFLDSDYNEEWTLSWKQREQEEKAQSI